MDIFLYANNMEEIDRFWDASGFFQVIARKT